MSVPLEHDYIGLSESSSMERSSEKIPPPSSSSSSSCSAEAEKKNKTGLHLKATELRLGLPGFGKDLEEDTKNGFPLSPMKNSVSGAKRGFSDAIDGSSKWVFGGSEASGLYSPRCGVNGGLDSKNRTQSVKDAPTQNNKQQPAVEEKKNGSSAPAAKAQVVGWPPIRSYRKNTMASNLSKNSMDVNVEANQGSGCLYVKVSMDGAPYLRKVDLKIYHNYAELSSALEKMFSCFTLGQCASHGISESRLKDLLHGSECVLTYEDKDSDWMLVGDVPWEMFIDSCRRLRIMKGSEAIGLAPRAMEKCKSRN